MHMFNRNFPSLFENQKLIAEAGEFRMAIVRSAMERHPGLTVEKSLEMMDFFGA